MFYFYIVGGLIVLNLILAIAGPRVKSSKLSDRMFDLHFISSAISQGLMLWMFYLLVNFSVETREVFVKFVNSI